jgi:DNA-binding NarL/FixJ family response regulator
MNYRDGLIGRLQCGILRRRDDDIMRPLDQPSQSGASALTGLCFGAEYRAAEKNTEKNGFQMEERKKRIFLVDDHSVVRQGLSQFINNMDDLRVCGEAEDASEAIRLLEDSKPDIVIVDISLKGANGIDLTRAIKNRFNFPVLILSMLDEGIYAERAIKAGARGYIMKSESIEKVIDAVREIISGKIYLSPRLKENLLSKLLSDPSDRGDSPIDSLTNRELEVFRLIGEGLSSRHIASDLLLSIKTIETYRERMKKKLNLNSSDELVQYAIQWRLDERK